MAMTNPNLKLTPIERMDYAISLARGFITPEDFSRRTGLTARYGYKLKETGHDLVLNPEKRKVYQYKSSGEKRRDMERLVVLLSLDARSSYKGICRIVQSVYKEHISMGGVSDIISKYEDIAKEKGEELDRMVAEHIKQGANDEIFQGGDPVFGGVDLASGYACLLASSPDRTAESWEIAMMLLKDVGIELDMSISDAGKGLVKGIGLSREGIRIQLDVFHQLRDAGRPVSSVIRQFNGRLNKYEELSDKIAAEKCNCVTVKNKEAIEATIEEEFKTVYELETAREFLGEIVSFTGYGAGESSEMVKWLGDEMEILRQRLGTFTYEKDGKSHRIYKGLGKFKEEIEKLKNRSDGMVQFIRHMWEKMDAVAEENGYDKVSFRLVYRLRCQPEGSAERKWTMRRLRRMLGERLPEAMGKMDTLVKETHRASSLIESTNSRIRTYMDAKRYLPARFLPLLRLYLNTTPYERSRVPEKLHKSSAEVILGRKIDFLELLGLGENNQ